MMYSLVIPYVVRIRSYSCGVDDAWVEFSPIVRERSSDLTPADWHDAIADGTIRMNSGVQETVAGWMDYDSREGLRPRFCQRYD